MTADMERHWALRWAAGKSAGTAGTAMLIAIVVWYAFALDTAARSVAVARRVRRLRLWPWR